jgi:hypothetical protein
VWNEVGFQITARDSRKKKKKKKSWAKFTIFISIATREMFTTAS